MVRHLGWGLTWIIAGFVATLAVASVLEQRAIGQREQPTAHIAPPTTPAATLRAVAGEQRSRGFITVSNGVSE